MCGRTRGLADRGIRRTGVLENRDGKQAIVPMSASLATGKVFENVKK
jgi:hypothetical protein